MSKVALVRESASLWSVKTVTKPGLEAAEISTLVIWSYTADHLASTCTAHAAYVGQGRQPAHVLHAPGHEVQKMTAFAIWTSGCTATTNTEMRWNRIDKENDKLALLLLQRMANRTLD